MSFLRAEARAVLWRWREVAAAAGVTLFGVHLIGRAVDRAALGTGMVAVGITGVGVVLFFFAVLRLRLSPVGTAAGVVEVDERQVGYLTADDGGGFVSINDLTRLELVGAAGDRHWVLSHLAGPALVIPASADGAEQLFDAFAALPGLRIEDAARAMGRDGPQLIWTRAIT